MAGSPLFGVEVTDSGLFQSLADDASQSGHALPSHSQFLGDSILRLPFHQQSSDMHRFCVEAIQCCGHRSACYENFSSVVLLKWTVFAALAFGCEPLRDSIDQSELTTIDPSE